jgi:hypothetical protein
MKHVFYSWRNITEYGWTADSESMKKEQTLPSEQIYQIDLGIQSTGWLAPKQPKNLHLPHDTRLFQDLYEHWQAWTRNT